MVKKYIGLLGLFLLLHGSVLAQALAYGQNFKQLDPKWSDHDDTYEHEKVENNKFSITEKRAKYAYKTVEVPLEDSLDYSIETQVVHVSGEDSFPYGLVFAADGATNNYIFAISANGRYIFGGQNQGVFTPIIHWTESPAIKTGVGQSNKLRIETAGANLKLIINGRQVNKIPMIQPFGNEIGFIVGNPQTDVFDYLLVNYLADTVKETDHTPSKPIAALPVTDTVKHVAGSSGTAIASVPLNAPAKPIPVPQQPPLVPGNTITDTTKKLSNTQVKPTVADTNKNIVPQSVSPAITPTVNASVTPQVVETPKQPVNTTAVLAAKDTAKKPVNQAVASIVDQQLNAVIIDTPFYSNFSNADKNRWSLNQSDSVVEKISGHVLKITRKSDIGFTDATAICKPEVDMQRDVLLQTEVMHYSGNENFGYGIEFGGDSTRQFHFWITASGHYSIRKTENGFTTTISDNITDFIKKGDSVKNALAIEHKAGQLYFFINNQQVEKRPELDSAGRRFGLSVSKNQAIVFNNFSIGYLDKLPPPETEANSKPKITITSPEVTRGLRIEQTSDVVHVVGTATDLVGISYVKVNDIPAGVDDRGNFMADVKMALGDNVLNVIAQNNQMRTGVYTFHITRKVIPAAEQAAVTQIASEGNNFALLIGEQEYQDQRIPSLEEPLVDAKKLSDALVNNYTFSKENIKILPNPSRSEFFTALDELKNEVGSEDNVIIFYAGHGTYDEEQLQGYWFPADANKDRRDTWISNSEVLGYVRAIKSKHTLLISDACFSGSIFKGRGIELAPKVIQELYKLQSRKAMTSGSMKQVPDKSVFVEYLIKRLNDNTDKYLSAESLFFSFKEAVVNNSPIGQVPQFGEIREAGDEGGDFIFFKKN